MKNTIITGLLLALAAFPTAVRADYTTNLVVGWTFNDGSLTSDLGTLSATFSQSGTGGNQTTTFNSNGTVSLGAGRVLSTTAVNSTDIPSLSSALTIWVRLRLDGTPQNDAVLFGLLNATAPATTGNAARVATYGIIDGTTGTARFTGLTSSGTTLGAGSGFSAVSTNQFVEVAIRIQDLGTVSSLYSDWLNTGGNGTTVSRTWDGSAMNLQSFVSFAIGRVNSYAAAALTFDEIRIYDAYLTDAQLASISAIAIPEPSSVALLLGAAGLGLVLCRRPARR